jgi:hypothetical protein
LNNEVYNPTEDWAEDDWTTFTTWLKDALQSNEVTVTFTKKDGSDRVMKCTLDPKVLPPSPVIEAKTERKKSENTLAVYDLEAQAWRSFTIKSVKKITFSIPKG